MVERSSTSAVTYFGSYGSRPIDRALGAAVTLSVGVFLFQLLNRYVRRLNKDWEKDSWITALVTLILSRSVKEVQPSSTDTAVHRGACHCRSVTFEVSSVNMFYSSLELSREFVRSASHGHTQFLASLYNSSEVRMQSKQRMARGRYITRIFTYMRLIFGSLLAKIY